MTLVKSPFEYFTDTAGGKLANGKIYIGGAGLNPVTNPINIYSNTALSVSIAQPVRTTNGYPTVSGSPVQIHIAENTDYSIAVYDENDNLVFTDLYAINGEINNYGSKSIIATGGVTALTISDRFGYKKHPLDFGAVGNGTTNDNSAFIALEAVLSGQRVDLLGKTYLVTTLPTGNNYFNGAFKIGVIIYPQKDYFKSKTQRVTKTPVYSTWAQDKAFVHNNIIYVPFQLAHGHTYDTTQIAMVASYDGGNTYTVPKILIGKHSGTVYGWNCFSAGVVGNRFCLLLEERVNADASLNTVFLYSRPMDATYYRTGGIALTSGSAIATITIPNHGLKAGDIVHFSGVSGTDTGGLSGELTVVAWVSKDTFTVDKGSNSASNQSSVGGDWILGVAFDNNSWSITDLGDFDTGGTPATHIHSFAVKNADTGSFFVGYHNGGISPREVGVIEITNLFTTPSATKRAVPTDMATSQAEPCIRYNDSVLYMATRSQGISVKSKFGYSIDSGVNWTYSDIDLGSSFNLSYGDPIPFEIIGTDIYMFATERREGEFTTGTLAQYVQNNPRSFMVKGNLGEFKTSDYSSAEIYNVAKTGYAGEQASSGAGVGSTVQYNGSVIYFFGGEDYRTSTRYSYNLPSVDNQDLAQGYQPDIWSYSLNLGSDDEFSQYEDSAFDNEVIEAYEVLGQEETVVATGTRFQKRVGGLLSGFRQSLTIASNTITPTLGYSLLVVDTEGAASADFLDTITPANSVIPYKDGDIIIIQSASSSRDVLIRHGVGNINLSRGARCDLNTAQQYIMLIHLEGDWYEICRSTISGRINYKLNDSTVVIASGVLSITPATSSYFIDTEGAASTDDLDNITDTSAINGDIIIISLASASRVVTVRDNSASGGNIFLAGGANYNFGSSAQSRLMLQYYNGNWYEISSSTN